MGDSLSLLSKLSKCAFWNVYPDVWAKRFWDRVPRGWDDDCWEWIGAKKRSGYGVVCFHATATDKKLLHVLCTHIVWYLSHGQDPNGLYLLHKCDNPPCVNPRHLFLGTREDNWRDRHSKGRTARGSRLSKNLTESSVAEIKRLVMGASAEEYLKISADFGVATGVVRLIAIGKTWKHVAPATDREVAS